MWCSVRMFTTPSKQQNQEVIGGTSQNRKRRSLRALQTLLDKAVTRRHILYARNSSTCAHVQAPRPSPWACVGEGIGRLVMREGRDGGTFSNTLMSTHRQGGPGTELKNRRRERAGRAREIEEGWGRDR